MTMAIPLPNHLSRRANSQDVSSKILNKISDATHKTLTVELASSWVADLDRTIQQTKYRIHERIYAELPSFDHQLETSKSVQARLQNLTVNVVKLSASLNEPETGLVPILVTALSHHAALAQNTTDSEVAYNALTHLALCNGEFKTLSSHVQSGRLPDAVKACRALQSLLDVAPEPLLEAEIMLDMKRRFRALRDMVEEQLSDAYSRSIRITSSELLICPSVQVRESQTIIHFSDILASLSTASLTNHLSSLRRDIVGYFIDFPLKQPITQQTTISKDSLGAPCHVMSIFASTDKAATPPLTYLSSVFSFLSTHIFSCLPEPERTTFPLSLRKPTTNAVLHSLLVPTIPSSLHTLPAFLTLIQDATAFEDDVLQSLGDAQCEREVLTWAANVRNHYGRKRRVDLLARARALITNGGEEHVVMVDSLDQDPEPAPAPQIQTEVVAVQGDECLSGESDGWGLDEDVGGEDGEAAWGLEDDSNGVTADAIPAASDPPPEEVEEEDPADAWGWNDDLEDTTSGEPQAGKTEGAWDEPWGAPSSRPPTPPPSEPRQPKLAKRLEKFSSKGKTGLTPSSTAPSSPAVGAAFAQQHVVGNGAASHVLPSTSKHVPDPVRTDAPPRPREREMCAVSSCAQDVLHVVEEILAEGNDLTHSTVFDEFALGVDAVGTVRAAAYVLQTAPAVLDLYRALYPATFPTAGAAAPERAMRFSNDCLLLGSEVKKLEGCVEDEVARTQLRQSAEQISVFGEWYFDDAVDKQRAAVQSVLQEAKGFEYTADQDRFDECEMAMSTVLREIMTIGRRWKTTLARSKYYRAIGSVVDAALTKILGDILTMTDIPEVESRKLSELLRMLNAVESLFVESDDEPSLVLAFVPSWLKYSYTSELLEASIADISYLFDEGALVDFDVQELAGLVRALFADTPLRTNTIAKLMAGHAELR